MRDPAPPSALCEIVGPADLARARREIDARVVEDSTRWRRERERRADFSALPLTDVPPSAAGFVPDAAASAYVEVCLDTRADTAAALARMEEAERSYRAAFPASFHRYKGQNWRPCAAEYPYIEAFREARREWMAVSDRGAVGRSTAAGTMTRVRD